MKLIEEYNNSFKLKIKSRLMRLTESVLLDIVKEKILSDKNFDEALEITKRNSSGKIWLIGSGLYIPLINGIYEKNLPEPEDLDFLVEERKLYENLILPEGYEAHHSRFVGIKIEGKLKIDILDIEHFWPSAINFVEPTIENFLLYTPLNIYSIAYDLFDKKIVGDVGIEAIYKKTIEINNKDSADFCSRIMRKTAIEMVLEKADALGFKAEFI